VQSVPGYEQIFSRTSLLIGDAGLRRLAAARVLIAGVGGVGSCAVGVGPGRMGRLKLLTVIGSVSTSTRQLHA